MPDSLVVLPWVLALMLAQTEEDVSQIDQSPLDPAVAERALLEQRTRLVPLGASLTLAHGEGVLVVIPVLAKVKSAPAEVRLEARVAEQKGGAKLRWHSPCEVTRAQITSGALDAQVQCALRAATKGTAEEVVAGGRLEIAVAGQEGPPLVTRGLEQRATVGPPVVDTAELELDRKAYLFHQGQAEAAYAALPALKDHLRLDRVDPPPADRHVAPDDRAPLQRFLHHRLRADLARERLRAAVEVPDPALSQAAARAIGSLSKKPTGATARASAIEGETVARALKLTEAALFDLRVDEAEAFLSRLRASGRLEEPELAQLLVLAGAVHFLRGRDEDAARSFGQARCLDGQERPDLRRPFLLDAQAKSAKSAKRCDRPLAIGAVTATRESRDAGPVIAVRASFAPDPLAVGEGGDIEVWGSGGAVHRAEKIRAEHEDGAGRLVAEFADTGQLENYSGQLLVRVLVRDLSGVSLAGFGDPDPQPISIAQGTSPVAVSELPSWIWWVAGGVVLVGAGTAGAVLLLREPDKRFGIGPVGADF